jgi:hypothetical protein
MNSRFVGALGAAAALVMCACGPPAAVGASPVLPLRSLRLYDAGVGYFERSGRVAAGGPPSLPVPAGHIDDALKTLVVLSGQGRAAVHGVEFGSSISHGMARALAGLPADENEPLSLEKLLVGLKGAQVEVRARSAGAGASPGPGPATASETGRIAEVVEGTDATIVILTDAGAILRMAVRDIESVRPLDPAYRSRLDSALDALSARTAQSERLLRVLATGGPVTLGYIAETPVWRTTYRLVLDDSGESGVLQGWALLHNDTDEDWRGVRVELANGRPDSFLFPLAAPRYTRRELLTPDDPLATVPQLMGTTVDAIWGDRVADANGSVGLGRDGSSEGGGVHGGAIADRKYGGVGHGWSSASSPLLRVGDLASTAPAAGAEAGALFVYALGDPVDLHAHASTLVPFAQERVDARSIAWVDSPGAPARSALRFVNSTAQTLPAGTLAVFADRGFAGESTVDRLKPGERRFVTYGLDLDVELRSVDARSSESPQRLVWVRETQVLEEHYLRTADGTIEIENRSGVPRWVVLATSLDKNATLTGADQVDFDAARSQPLAVFRVDARKKTSRTLHSVEGLVRETGFALLSAARLTELAGATSLDARTQTAASEASARLREAESAVKAAEKAESQIAEVTKDLERLREHMKAAAGDGRAPANPFSARVLAGEDRLTALRTNHERLDAAATAKKEAAQAALAKLSQH